jgi:hypothetical protein
MGNMGLAFRFRDMLMPVFFIFTSVGITKISEMFIQKRKGNGELQCQNI